MERVTKASALIFVLILFRAMPLAAAECDRACLRGIVTQYLEAFVAHQPNAAFAPNFKYIEDAIDTKPGDGLWKEAAKLRTYRIDVLDARLGVAGTMTLVDVNGGPAMIAVAAKVVDRKIVQLETLVAHNRTEGVLFDIDSLEKKTSPIGALVPPAARTTRESAIKIGELYPAGLKAGSFVTVDVPFGDDAYRFENGRLMAGPGCTFLPGCDRIKTQGVPKLSGFTYRLLAFDEDTGVVWLDEDFGAGSIRNSSASLRAWEAFKVYGGQIHAVEAFMKAMPTVAVNAVSAAEQVAPKQAGYVVPRTP